LSDFVRNYGIADKLDLSIKERGNKVELLKNESRLKHLKKKKFDLKN